MTPITIVGIIAEYNPFHNGHRYLIEELRRRTGADYVVAAMSGDFVQRGEPAVFDKYTRTRMALCGGVDLVVELPSLFATSSAEDFSACGVALLHGLGCDFLGFGSESGDLEVLKKAADLFEEESAEWKDLLQSYLKQGKTYPAARSFAAEKLTQDPELSALLASPNNILATEYLKALKRQKTSMIPVTIRRKGAGYHDTDCLCTCASASAIRSVLDSTGGSPTDLSIEETLQKQIPKDVFEALLTENALTAPLFVNDLTELLHFRLLSALHNGEDLSNILDLSPELAIRLTRQSLQFVPFQERVMQLKTKGYTYTRISRALLHLLLYITKEQACLGRSLGYAPYARILGFRKSAGPLLSHIRRQSSLPMITKTADAKALLSPDAMKILEIDFYASHVYQSLLASHGRQIRNEYTKSVIVL